jgi:hypothetical protein
MATITKNTDNTYTYNSFYDDDYRIEENKGFYYFYKRNNDTPVEFDSWDSLMHYCDTADRIEKMLLDEVGGEFFDYNGDYSSSYTAFDLTDLYYIYLDCHASRVALEKVTELLVDIGTLQYPYIANNYEHYHAIDNVQFVKYDEKTRCYDEMDDAIGRIIYHAYSERFKHF